MTLVIWENSRLRHYLARLHRKTFCYSRVRRDAAIINQITSALPIAYYSLPHKLDLHPPRVINVNKNAAYPNAVDELKADSTLPKTTKLRRVKYLNNIVEQDRWFIKRLVNPCMGFSSFNTARRTLRGYNEYD